MEKELWISTYEENTLLFKETLIGKIQENNLYFNNDIDTFKLDLKKEIFTKENLESVLKIKKDKALLTLKELDKTFAINVKYHNFLIEKNKIYISYLLESQEKPIRIEIEMSDENA